MIKRLKLTYELYNLFHKKELKHNIPLYKKYGIKKKYYSSISSQDFDNSNAEALLTTERSTPLASIPFYQHQSEETMVSIQQFDDQGYCVINQYLDEEKVSTINSEIDRLIDSGELQFKYGNKLVFAIHKSDQIKDICEDPELKPLLNYLIQGDAKLFQSINFLKGSEQDTHSDSIHMTTYPLGGLLGVWIALQDIDLDNGPVHYIPESHKLPYYMNADYDNVGSKFFLGDKGYVAYEKMIDGKVADLNLQKKAFTAKAGDMFIWHANLLHGGNPHTNKSKTRKSMVLHYFDANRICYHEITQRPALIKKDQA